MTTFRSHQTTNAAGIHAQCPVCGSEDLASVMLPLRLQLGARFGVTDYLHGWRCNACGSGVGTGQVHGREARIQRHAFTGQDSIAYLGREASFPFGQAPN